MKTNDDVESIFTEAIELVDPSMRGDFVDRACGDDLSLRNRLRRLLAANDRAVSFMSEPASVLKLSQGENGISAIGEQPGDHVGRYELVEILGEGGMGTVFLAQQAEPVHRQVALKIVKPGLDTKEVIARFEAERQALALMNHPHIASALDAGATVAGRPYFVMELVKGVTITEYCNRGGLGLRQRLELFQDVCAAIQHAHQKGIIHRDIKPNNVLVSQVDGRALVKVIDFGIAKAVDHRLTEQTLLTRYGEFIGTPAYMSPEQAEPSGIDVDTRTDIYSLGVLLYELLTGLQPFDEKYLKRLAYDEMRRVIQQETPRKLSDVVDTRNEAEVTKVSMVCGPSRREWGLALAGELNWIVARAMDKDRERRYETVNALRLDIQRYLNDEPVIARPPTLGYRWKKGLYRHRSMVATAAIVAATLLVAAVTSGWWAWQATRARDESRRLADQASAARDQVADEAASLQEVVDFLNQDLLGSADPDAELNRDIRLRSVLDRASARVNSRSFSRPLVEAAVRTTLGETYCGVGEYAKAEVHLRRAEELYLRELGAHHEKTLATTNQRIATQLHRSEFAEAESLLAPQLSIAAKVLGESHEVTLTAMTLSGWLCESLGELDEADKILQEVLQRRLHTLGPDDVKTLKAMANLAHVYQSQGRYDAALDLLSRAYTGLTSDPVTTRPERLQVLSSLASLHLARHEFDDAESLYQSALAESEALLGPQHSQTLTMKHGLALIYAGRQNHRAAEELFEETLQGQRQQLGSTHANTLATMHNLALVESHLGHYAAAEALLREEFEGRRATLGAKHPTTIDAATALAALYGDQERFADAVPYYEEILARSVQGSDAAIATATLLGVCQFKSGHPQTARTTLDQALTLAQASMPDQWLRFVIESLLGEVLAVLGERELAEASLLRGYEGLRQCGDDLPARWRPLGMRAATQRLAAFYEAAESEQQRSRAKAYRDQWLQLRDERSALSSEPQNVEERDGEW